MNGINHPLQQYMPQAMQRSAMQPQQHSMVYGIPQFANPMQKMSYIMQAMQNPAQFVRQHLPGVPEQALQDPTGNAVLRYMQQNMGVTQQDIQNAAGQIPRY